MSFKLTYKSFGERAILIEWPQRIDENILNDILIFKSKISNKNIEQLLELKHAYNSLLITYKTICRNIENDINFLKTIYTSSDFETDNLSNLWKIPVCYDDTFGLDLDFIAKEKSISKTELIKRHTQATYTVCFIGFLPGFLYLGGLDETLYMPRKSSPRLHIEKGAVGIGGNQTGVYPNVSPGGWNIIGNSPIHFFDVLKEKPCFAKAGDQVQFYTVSLKKHQDIKTLVDANVYQLESTLLDD